MNKYTTVFFDWSGVVADDRGDDFVKKQIFDLGADDVILQSVMNNEFVDFMKGRVSEEEFWKIIIYRYNLKSSQPNNGRFDNWAGLNPNSDIINYINYLKKNGIKVAVLTNIIKPVYKTIKSSGYYDLFDFLIASCEINLAKPQKEIYQYALDLAETKAINSVFIDDKMENVEAAKKLGFTTITANDSAQIMKELDNIIDLGE